MDINNPKDRKNRVEQLQIFNIILSISMAIYYSKTGDIRWPAWFWLFNMIINIVWFVGNSQRQGRLKHEIQKG